MKDIDKLRKIYNCLETSVRNLANLGVEITSYGTLLISIIFDVLRDFVPFVQFKKREKHPWRSVNFSKIAG